MSRSPAIHDGVTAIETAANDPRVREKVAAVDDVLAETNAVIGAGTVYWTNRRLNR